MIRPQACQAVNFNALANAQQRAFAKKGRKAKKSPDEPTEEEEVAEPEHVVEEPVAEPTPVAQPEPARSDFAAAAQVQPQQEVSRDLFQAFSVGDVKQVQSTPGNKPPSQEDTIEGRYAAVLFSSASEQEALYTIYEDISYLKALFDNSESFKLFTQNAGIGAKEMRKFNDALKSLGDFHPLTIKFLEVLAENKRLTFISGIATRYVKLYQQFNKEEKITIISAESLSASEQQEVLDALKANPQNSGKDFQLDFTVDASIKGGLQMYTETEFMDMSLASRLDRLRADISKLVD